MRLIRSALLALVLLILISPPVLGVTRKARLTARTLSYDYENKRVTATGDVVLEYLDIRLTADYVDVDLDENTVWARGNVKLRDKHREAESDELVYDLDTRSGALYGMKGTFTDPSIKGPVIISSESASVSEGEYILKKAYLTTCDRPEPHFRLEAAEIEVYLNDQIILRKVRYYEGKYHLFSLPYLVISLKDDGMGLQVPQFGYSAAEGVFVKVSYGYVINGNHSGVVRLDMMERIGMATGIEHRVRIGENFTGTAGVYQTLNRTNTHIDWRLNASAEQKFGDMKASLSGVLNHLATPIGEDYNTYQARAGLTGRTNIGTANLTGDYRFNELTHETDIIMSGNTNLRWNNGYSLSVVGSFRMKELPAKDPLTGQWIYDPLTGELETVLKRLADYTIRGARTWEWGTLSILLEEKMNLDAVQQGTTWQAVVRQPEVALLFPKVEIPLLGPFRFNFSFSRFIEQPLGTSTTRTTAEIERQAFSLTRGGFNLSLGAKARGSYYGTGDYLFVETAGLTWNQKYTSWLRSSTTASWTAVQGETPFTFDRPVEGASVTSGLFFEHKAIQAQVSSGYDFARESFRDVAARFRVNLGQGDYLQLSGSYNPTSQLFGLMSLEGNTSGEKARLKAKVLFNPNDLQFRQADLDAGIILWERWTLEGRVNYDLMFDAFTQAALSLGYDWHCREIKFSYDFVNQGFRFSLIFKAFPDKGLGFGSSM